MTNSHIADHTYKTGQSRKSLSYQLRHLKPKQNKNKLILRPSEKRSLSLQSQEWNVISQEKCLYQLSGSCSLGSLKDRNGLLSSHSFTSWPDIQTWTLDAECVGHRLDRFLPDAGCVSRFWSQWGSGKRLCHDQMSVFLLGTSCWRKCLTERFHSHSIAHCRPSASCCN